MRKFDWPWERIFTLGPFLGTIALLLVGGVVTGQLAYAPTHSSVVVNSATISSDGSTCRIVFYNKGNGASHLSQVNIEMPGDEHAVSFGQSFSMKPNQNTTFNCSLGKSSQFVPPFMAHPGMEYNLTARFDDGTKTSYTSGFS